MNNCKGRKENFSKISVYFSVSADGDDGEVRLCAGVVLRGSQRCHITPSVRGLAPK